MPGLTDTELPYASRLDATWAQREGFSLSSADAANPHDHARPDYERLLAGIDGVIWEADAQTLAYTFVSAYAGQLLALPEAAWLAPGFWGDRVAPEDREWAAGRRLQALHSGEACDLEYRLVAADGRLVWVRDIMRARVAGDPRRRGLIVDITPRMIGDFARRDRADEGQREHLRFLQHLDHVNRAMRQATDLQQMMQDVLDALLAIFDCDRAWMVYPCDPEAELWRVPMERTRPEYPGALALGRDMPLDPNGAQIFRILRAAGGPVRFGLDAPYPVPEPMAKFFGVQAFMATALYPKLGKPWSFGLHQCSYPRVWTQAEERLLEEIGRRLADTLTSLLARRDLEESERRYREIFQKTSDLLVVVEVMEDGRFQLIDVNPVWDQLMGIDRAAILGIPLETFGSDEHESLRSMLARFRECVERGAPLDFAQVLLTPTGRWDVHATLIPVSDGAGRTYRLIGVGRNITEQRRAEAARVESYNLLHAVVEGTADAIFVKNLAGRYLMINSAGARILGRGVQEVIGRTDDELFGPEVGRSLALHDRKVLDEGALETFEEILSLAGATRTYLATRGVYRDAEGRAIGLIGISRDVTDMKRLEEQFRHAQKMEAVGRLAGGVAHDFNNLLTIINGNSELVLADLPSHDPNHELLVEILRTGERAAGLTRQLLAFSRKQVLQPEVVRLNGLLSELLKLLQRLIGEDIELQFSPSAGSDLAKVDPSQFEQAIINLAINARDAMPQGGRLTIETSACELGADYTAYRADVRPGAYTLIAVSDTGHGMDEETRLRAFEPFFTTKESGKGTGLGLAIVYGFVKQSGGHVEIYSEVGVGTTFKVYLPHTEQPRADDDWPEPLDMLGGSETVLVVEDEEALRGQIRLILQTGGYTVLEAADGAEALRVARQHPGDLHLLLTDLVMPRLSGRQLAERLAAERPGVVCIFMSGYADEAAARHGVLETGAPFLQKPFSPTALSRKVREILDAGR